MNMKRLLTLVAFFATVHASAQQVNPVPDYVFSNRMSAGRNTVTDTAAYFSIGPRYGATRGMMPPMVVDTASFSANKRNGLLIFSVQKNKFLYWDSVGVKWAEMAGTGGTAISSGDTAAMLLPYVRHAGYGLIKSGQALSVDSGSIATRARVQKSVDSLGAAKQDVLTNPITGTGSQYLLAKFNSSSQLVSSNIFDNAFPQSLTQFVVNPTSVGTSFIQWKYNSIDMGLIGSEASAAGGTSSNFVIYAYGSNNLDAYTNNVRRTRITSSGELLINTTTDNGDFKIQVSGNSFFDGNIRTAAPAGGTANDWRLGTVATVSPTSPNRTIEVSIGGTIYYIAAKTTND